jgi:hypothetical protein
MGCHVLYSMRSCYPFTQADLTATSTTQRHI